MDWKQREKLHEEKARRKKLKYLARFFEENHGRETHLIFCDTLIPSGAFETIAKGFLVRAPKSEGRSSFCITYESEVPSYKSNSSEPVGKSIFYALLRPGKISVEQDRSNPCRIFTEDRYAMFGGSFFRREDLERLAELNVFPSLNADTMSGSYVRESDL